MRFKVSLLLLMFLVFSQGAMAAPLGEQGHWFASFLTIAAILVTLPAFVSLYLHMRRTNLGNMLFQPFLAMFIGFIGIMLNSIIGILRSQSGYPVDDFLAVMGINRAISSVLIAVGCVMLFFTLKKHGLFEYIYYQKSGKKVKPPAPKARARTKG